MYHRGALCVCDDNIRPRKLVRSEVPGNNESNLGPEVRTDADRRKDRVGIIRMIFDYCRACHFCGTSAVTFCPAFACGYHLCDQHAAENCLCDQRGAPAVDSTLQKLVARFR